MKNEKKMNNKGFSLVELIIVIAIMAVLVAVLAPQYMRFIERGRAASDRDNLEAMRSALEVYYVDPIGATHLEGGESLTVSRTAITVGAGGKPAAITAAMEEAGLIATGAAVTTLPHLANQNTFTSATITVTINANGTASVAVAETP